jgi:hypothetical protein
MRVFAVALLALSVAFTSVARADAPTPFVEDPYYKVGMTYTESGSIISLGGASYLVVVQSDTDDYYVLRATAPKGVVKPEQLGKPMKVEAKIVSREKRKNQVPEIKLEILSVK